MEVYTLAQNIIMIYILMIEWTQGFKEDMLPAGPPSHFPPACQSFSLISKKLCSPCHLKSSHFQDPN